MSACSASWWIDHVEFDINAIDVNRTVRIPQEKMSWQDALGQALAEHKLAFYPEYDCIRITTQEYSEAEECVRVFDTRKMQGRVSANAFMADLMRHPDLGPWLDVDDEGGVARAIGPLVIVRHSIYRQMKIAQLLAGKK